MSRLHALRLKLKACHTTQSMSRPQNKPTSDKFWSRGEPMVWVAAGTLAAILLVAGVLLTVVLVNGLAYFWPSRLEELQLADGTRLLGRRMSITGETGNGADFPFRTANKGFDPKTDPIRRIKQSDVFAVSFPPDALVVERQTNSDFYGTFVDLELPSLDAPTATAPLDRFRGALSQLDRRRAAGSIRWRPASPQSVTTTRRSKVRTASWSMQKNRPATSSSLSSTRRSRNCKRRSPSSTRKARSSWPTRCRSKRNCTRTAPCSATARGRSAASHWPTWSASISLTRWDLSRAPATISPRYGSCSRVRRAESFTEGGVLPALFGTISIIFLMAITSFPLGVLAGIYLGEYAQDGALVRIVRIGVNNLAGIPSIVYGIFGAGFFVDYLGVHIDQHFFPQLVGIHAVFGTGGVLWAALTLGLLTVPVVIVATEEAIRVIPRGVREGSYAMGATKFQTLRRVVLPLASPGILTGFILAMARAAGEVAPLMLTGVVNSAPPCRSMATFPTFTWSGSSCTWASSFTTSPSRRRTLRPRGRWFTSSLSCCW